MHDAVKADYRVTLGRGAFLSSVRSLTEAERLELEIRLQERGVNYTCEPVDDLEVSQDAEGNGPGFILGLPVPK